MLCKTSFDSLFLKLFLTLIYEFKKYDKQGVLWWGTVIAGILVTVVAAFVPFHHLNDMISAGVLVAFVMTNSSLVLMRYDSPDDNDGLTERLLVWFNFASFAICVAVTHFWEYLTGKAVTSLCVYKLVRCLYGLTFVCKPVASFGGKRHSFGIDIPSMSMTGEGYFKTPCMPLVPCLGMFVNWYLISQLELQGIVLLLFFITIVCVYYFAYGRSHSVGNNGGWVTRPLSVGSLSDVDDSVVGDQQSVEFKTDTKHDGDKRSPLFKQLIVSSFVT